MRLRLSARGMQGLLRRNRDVDVSGDKEAEAIDEWVEVDVDSAEKNSVEGVISTVGAA